MSSPKEPEPYSAERGRHAASVTHAEAKASLYVNGAVAVSTAHPPDNGPANSEADVDVSGDVALAHQLSPAAVRRVLISLMFPAMLMPLVSSMTSVALPMIRQEFAISADMTAWVTTAFTLPFMMLMPVIGRLSDSVGKRRMLLAGIAAFWVGSLLTLAASSLNWIMVGRVIQGLGVSGMMPLGIAFISTIFRPEERGKPLGTWSSVGPVVGFMSPLAAGFLVEQWHWRAAFAPPLLVGLIAFVAVYKGIPSGLSTVRPNFWRSFDWLGVILLSLAAAFLLFFLSSRPITGVAPLRDWRLGLGAIVWLTAFVWWERERRAPFINLHIFSNPIFSVSSVCASIRMVTMAGTGFLLPLYLTDIHAVPATALGGMMMFSPGAMALMVRFGGQVADRWGSRWPVIGGFAAQAGVMFGYATLDAQSSLWSIGTLQVVYGLGVGLMLAALHRSAMGGIPDEQMGAAAGLYSMIRFAGMAVGSALAGVLLQNALDANTASVDAYRSVYFFFGIASSLGIVLTLFLREPEAVGSEQ